MHIHKYLLIALCLMFCATTPALGQSQNWITSNGVLHITDWPETAVNHRSVDSLKVHAAVLPAIDTLSIGYGYRITEAQPYLTFALEWKPGTYAILDGERISWEDLRGEVQIESLRLSVDVTSENETVSTLDFVVDSLMLPAYPGLFSEEISSLTWDTVFPDLADTTARTLFDRGFTLSNPQIAHISFAYFDEEGNLAQRTNNPQVMPRRPSRRTVYGPNIDIGIRIPVIIHRPTPRPRNDDGPRTVEPRGERVGRGDTTDDDRRRTSSDDRRQTERTNPSAEEEDNEADGGDILGNTRNKKNKDDDDEEDEDELLPAAIAGVAAVALVATAGGTIGYYGNSKTPIGLTSGYVQPDGGVLLSVGVNSAVIERSESDTEYFLGKVTGFYNMFNSPIQPAISLGVLAAEDNGDFEYDFSASVGLVGNFNQLILMGGYDFLLGGVDIGFAVNLKAKK